MNYILIAAAIVAALIIGYKLSEYFRNAKTQGKIRRGYKLEQEAADFLQRHGYKIISHHEPLHYVMWENKKSIQIKLESDYIVSKNKKKFLVEVKSGENTANIRYVPTRRQILEYFFASSYDGYFLLDMNSKQIYEIDFPYKKAIQRHAKPKIFLFLVAICFAAIPCIPEEYKTIICIGLALICIAALSINSK